MKTHQNQYLKHPDHLFSYWSYQPGIFVVIAITGILYNFGMLASPYFEGRLIDGIEGNETTSQIWALLGIFILTIVIVQIARILKRYFVRRFANNATYTMRLNIYNNILNLSSQELANADIGNLLARDISDVKNAVEGMRKLTTEIFDTVFLFAFYAIYLVLFDYQMTLYAFIPVIAAIVVAFSMRTMIYKAKSASRKLNSEMTSKTYDLFENAMTYRTFGRDDDNLKDYDKTLNEYEKKNFKATVLTDTMIPIAYVIALLGLIPVVYLGVQHVSNSDPLFAPIPNIMNSTWTIGQFSTYLSTFVLMSTKASHTAKLFGSIESGLASWKRIKPQIKPYKEYSNPVEINNDNKLIASNLCVRIDNKCLFHALSFEAKKGEVIGITGPIASGKSALGKVFLQLLPYNGSLKLFGKEVSSYLPNEISGTVSYMGHQTSLLTESLEDNIALGEDKPVLPYLNEVAFTADLNDMPLKEQTMVGNEGVKLSGGQQERIALARTIYHKKGLVILDDPFASVDAATEREIIKNIKNEFQDSVVLLISHRLTSFKTLDKIIALNGDSTINIGTHDELIKSCPVYRNLYQLQETSGEVKSNERL